MLCGAGGFELLGKLMEIQFLTVEMELLVNTDVRDGFGTTRIVNWAGCVIQNPHPAVRALRFLPRKVTGSMWQGGARALWGSVSSQMKYGDSSPEDHQFVGGLPVYPV
ncbi:hypothetical protein AXG93_3507s1400 [Marchantia polymorpha subsp. ruderalis]|uniref:Uncharacterized protein n=1 Tax=Marchantia polymorpha subsp. ruderalis TaxID=1480154 RepID=A0A176VE97_MARPO|nr:hypothetical protein AXG93_3507s1400 [Marchantia polymorpha subsp. ruderalis]